MPPAASDFPSHQLPSRHVAPQVTRRSADRHSEGEFHLVEYDAVRIVVCYVGRLGRRGRILIEAPAGAAFT